MLETFLYWLFLFFLFNVLGWAVESVIESISHKRPLNRGFLAGPYIPIYGIGGILFALTGLPLKTAFDNIYVNIFLVFFVGMSLATLLEYMAGGILERVFKKQLWDYSTLKITNKFQYKNRISLVSSIFWGLLSLLMTYFLYGIVSGFVLSLDFRVLVTVNIIMALLMGTDTFIQIRRYGHIREFLEKLPHEQLREVIFKNLLRMGKREHIREFREAFYVKIKENVESAKENVKENVKSAKENVKENVKSAKENVKKNIQKLRSADDNGEQSEEGTDEI